LLHLSRSGSPSCSQSLLTKHSRLGYDQFGGENLHFLGLGWTIFISFSLSFLFFLFAHNLWPWPFWVPPGKLARFLGWSVCVKVPLPFLINHLTRDRFDSFSLQKPRLLTMHMTNFAIV
jgi:hypothetical protein